MLNADHGAFCNGFSPARAPPTSVRAHVHAQPPSMHVHRTHCSENCTVWPKPDQLDRLLRPCTPSVHLIHRNINLCCTCVCCKLSCGSVFIFIKETTAMTGKDPCIYYVYFVGVTLNVCSCAHSVEIEPVRVLRGRERRNSKDEGFSVLI